MAIAFTEIPEALLVPGQYQEIDNSLAGTVSGFGTLTRQKSFSETEALQQSWQQNF